MPGVPADPTKTAELRAASAKVAGGLWDVRVHYAAATTGKGETGKSPRLRGRAHAIASAFSMFAGSNWFARKKLGSPVAVMNSRRFTGRGSLLGVAELAAIAHLPTDAAAPGVERAGARAAVPPPGILTPTGPGADPALPPVKPLGVSESANPRPVGLAVADARQHVHILGATGSGKSTLMTHMILDDVQAGRGVVVIDPKGDLITDILARLPESAVGRTVAVRPRRRLRPAQPQRPATGASRRSRHDRRQPVRPLRPDLLLVLGTAHRRQPAQRVPDPAARAGGRDRRRHPGRHPPAARRGRLPQAHDREPEGPGPARLLVRIRAAQPRPSARTTSAR